MTRRILRDGDGEVRLRARSFDVLCCLVRRPGQIATKREIIKAVWPNTIVSDESLARCVSDIRLASPTGSNASSRRCQVADIFSPYQLRGVCLTAGLRIPPPCRRREGDRGTVRRRPLCIGRSGFAPHRMACASHILRWDTGRRWCARRTGSAIWNMTGKARSSLHSCAS